MKIFTWKVRGLNSLGKRHTLKQLFLEQEADIYILVETKAKHHSARKICASMLPDYEFLANYNSCRDGRVWVLWRQSLGKVHLLAETSQLMHFMVDLENYGKFIISAIYNSNLPLDRMETWSLLHRLAPGISLPWLVTGDFNQVRSNEEKIGGSRIPSHLLQHFNDCIDFCSLQDLKSIGNSLSWCNQSVGARRIMGQVG